jgi:HK97 family phage prohead protease
MIHRRNIAMAVEKRLQNLTPTTYNEDQRTVDAVLSRGSPVARVYGLEKLEISRKAVDLSRMTTSGISILDSHQQIGIANSLGKLTRVWVETDSAGPALLGTIRFHQTTEGKRAEAMVARGEISGVSVGYSVDPSDWHISDRDGKAVDPNSTRWGEDDLTFTAQKWTLAECSLVSVPADADAGMRAATALRADRAYQTLSPELRGITTRMKSRHAMVMRNSETLYVEPDHLPRASIFDAKKTPHNRRHYWDVIVTDAASSVQEIMKRMQKRHDETFGYPTYADCYFDQ